MSRSIWPNYGQEGAKVVHRVEVWTEQGYGPRKAVPEVIGYIRDAMAEMVADGIAEHDIKVSLDYDHSEGGYDGCDVTPKVVLHGERPATEAEVREDGARKEQARRQAKAAEVARLRHQLEQAERGLR